MNKFSVRKQIEKLREDFNAHIEEGSIPPKVRKTINSLFILLDLIVAAFLEKKTRKNSSIVRSEYNFIRFKQLPIE